MLYAGVIAEVAELADALASGASSRKGVEVRVLSSALHLARLFSPPSLPTCLKLINCRYGRFLSIFASNIYLKDLSPADDGKFISAFRFNTLV